MTIRERWDETRALIEAGWHSGWGACAYCKDWKWSLEPCPYCKARLPGPSPTDWADAKQAEADADRQLYGGLGTPQRED